MFTKHFEEVGNRTEQALNLFISILFFLAGFKIFF